MTNDFMEKRLADALEKTAPDDVDGVLSRCKERKGTVIPMTTKKTKKAWTTLTAACLALVLVGGGLFYQQANAVASVVSLDVNPSIELKVNRNEKVLACTPLNDDARAVLSNMGNGADLKGAKLDVAVNAIVGGLVRSGYLSDLSSAIMISVEDKDQTRAEKLQRELTDTVDGVLESSAAKASVLTQTVTQDAELEQQAKANNISTGKAALVNRIVAMNGKLSFDALAALSVEELNDLAEAGAPAMPIGKDKAMTVAAAEFAKATTAKAQYSEVDAELDDSPACYEVEFKTQSGEEFDYKIDAYTGAVLESKHEAVNGTETVTKPTGTAAQPSDTKTSGTGNTAPSSPAPTSDIGYAKAKSIALNHAGVSESAAYDMKVEPDDEDGVPVYEVSFKSGDMEYDYDIHAATGEILKHEAELDD